MEELEKILSPENFITIDNIQNDNVQSIGIKINVWGIYNILTNAPKEVFEKITKPTAISKHYDIGERAKASKSEEGIEKYVIKQNNTDFYVVYNGEDHNIRQRILAHFKGHQGTGCLAIFKYEELKEYKWQVKYLDLSNHDKQDNPLFRIYLEQAWRAQNGWPMLCKK